MRPLRTMWPFITPYYRTLIGALSALLIASASMLAMPVALRYLIDNGFVQQNLGTVNRYFGWFLAASILFSLFAALRYYLVTWLGERVVADVRNAVYARVIRMDPAFFEVTRTGEVLSRLTTDTTLVQSISGSGLSIALRSTLSLVGGLFMLILTSPRMAIYTLAGIVVVVLPVIVVGRYIRKLSRQSQDRVADPSGLAPSRKDTLPVGLPLPPPSTVTEATRVTVSVLSDGSGASVARVVTVGAGFTWWACADDALPV